MDHHSIQFDRKGLIILALVAMVLITMGSSLLMNNEVTIIIDGEEHVYNTTVETVEDLLKEEDILLEEYSYISVDKQEPVVQGLEIVINTPQDIVILDNNEEINIRSGYKTVEDILAQHDIIVGRDDYTVPTIKAEIVESENKEPIIIINRVQRETSVVTEAIEYETVTEENSEMYKGEEKVITEGQLGERTITNEIVTVNSEESNSRVVDNKVTREPVTEVKQVGTKERPVATTPAAKSGGSTPSGKNIARTYTMEATAYTDDAQSQGKWVGKTASGMKPQVGVVAVDPSVIPLHTKLYIEGYGHAVAGDTGGAIKGNRIDLFFNTRNECRQFGRRNITVHVLAD